MPRDTLKFDFVRGIPVLPHALLHKIESERQHGTLVAAESAKGRKAKSIHGLGRKKAQEERESFGMSAGWTTERHIVGLVDAWQCCLVSRPQKVTHGMRSQGLRAGALFSFPAELVGTSGDSVRS